tara:strand:+ start:204 stop:860 length:657 start_codon:yes stop_codon:yes gene_type:complete
MYKIFKEITIDDRMVDIAERHAYDRTKEIVQQFKGQYGGPSTHEESNYYGAIGELSVKKYLNLPVDLDSNYTDHKIDEGDIFYNNLIYDVKTTARMERYHTKLKSGYIQPWDPYGMSDFTSKHIHHLPKYTGGLIFTSFQIPNDAKQTKIQDTIRDEIKNNRNLLILGYVTREDVNKKQPTWYGPSNPSNPQRKGVKYKSPNFIFHFSELKDVKNILI